ncbi:MAG TPA: hypothetical protein VGB13_10220 [Candidatus Krumholzibacteria bacterium]
MKLRVAVELELPSPSWLWRRLPPALAVELALRSALDEIESALRSWERL